MGLHVRGLPAMPCCLRNCYREVTPGYTGLHVRGLPAMPCCLRNIPQGEGLLQRGEDSQQCHAASGTFHRGRGCYREVRTPSNAMLPQEHSTGGGAATESQQCHAASGGGAATER